MAKFKRLDEEKIDKLLTVRTTKALLKKEAEKGKEINTLEVTIEKNAEVMTNSDERDKHSKSMESEKGWFKRQLEKFKNPKNKNPVEIADPDHPLEILTGDVYLLLEIEKKEYYMFICRDIDPKGWLIPGGCPESRDELLKPKRVAERECGEEVGILELDNEDKEKRPKKAYYLYSSKKEWKENYQKWLKLINKEKKKEWEIKQSNIIKLKPKECSSKKGIIHAQKLIINMGDKKPVKIKNINVYINTETASVYIIYYRKVNFNDLKLSDLVFFDMELNRPVRLFTETEIKKYKRSHGIFVFGQDILSVGFSNPDIKDQV